MAGARFEPIAAKGWIRSVLKRKWIAPATIGENIMPRLVVDVSHAYSANLTGPKYGPTGRRIRNIDEMIQQNETRKELIRRRVLIRICLLILVGGVALSLAWWRLFHFAH